MFRSDEKYLTGNVLMYEERVSLSRNAHTRIMVSFLALESVLIDGCKKEEKKNEKKN